MDNYIAMILLARLKKNVDLSIEAIPVTPQAITEPQLGSILNILLQNKAKLFGRKKVI